MGDFESIRNCWESESTQPYRKQFAATTDRVVPVAAAAAADLRLNAELLQLMVIAMAVAVAADDDIRR